MFSGSELTVSAELWFWALSVIIPTLALAIGLGIIWREIRALRDAQCQYCGQDLIKRSRKGF